MVDHGRVQRPLDGPDHPGVQQDVTVLRQHRRRGPALGQQREARRQLDRPRPHRDQRHHHPHGRCPLRHHNGVLREGRQSAGPTAVVEPVTTQTDPPGRTPHTRTRTSDTTGRLTVEGRADTTRGGSVHAGWGDRRSPVHHGTPSLFSPAVVGLRLQPMWLFRRRAPDEAWPISVRYHRPPGTASVGRPRRGNPWTRCSSRSG